MHSTTAQRLWRRFGFRITFAVFLIVAGLPAKSSHAIVDIQMGSTGTAGSSGTNELRDGGDGNNGGDATATANTPGDSTNAATATGGTGGTGGIGFSGATGAGGDGGNGGSAGNAIASATTITSSPNASAAASAQGGTAGSGNNGGSGPGGNGTGGQPGSSGTAHASASGTNSLLGASMTVSALAFGSHGGNGGTPGGIDATDGSVATLDTVFGSANNGAVSVTALAQGGTGGTGGLNGGNGGNGASVFLDNAVSGSTSGTLNLVQEATAGAGGDCNNGTPGIPGTATSWLTVTDAVASVLSGRVIATGGRGGDGSTNDSGSNGAVADVIIDLTGNGSVNADADVFGGDGGSATFAAGNGAIATGTARGVSTMGGIVDVFLRNNGGDGTNSARAGSGANALVINKVGGSTSGLLRLEQIADGGNAGNGATVSLGIPGLGISSLTATNPDGGPIEGIASANGGTGSSSLGTFAPGEGGNALSIINLSSSANTVLATANATGGLGGNNISAGLSGFRGIGGATAQATTLNGYTATARATATGRDSVATSQSSTEGGAIAAMSLSGITNGKATVSTQTTAVIGDGFSTSLTGFDSMIRSNGLPSTNDVNNQLFGDPIVTAAYNASGVQTPLALAAMALDATNTMTATPNFSVTADYSFDLAMLTSGNLMVGLLDPTSSGPGFTSLQFTIEREGAIVEDQTFASAALASTYFDDHVLDLGAMATGVVGTLDLSITLAMVTPDNNTRFTATLLIANDGQTANPPGDYNDDGVIDAADYVVWRKKNNTATTLPNDTTSGTVTDADYTVWRAHFGQSASPGSGASLSLLGHAVPEPASSTLLLVAGLMSIAVRLPAIHSRGGSRASTHFAQLHTTCHRVMG